MGIKTIKAKSVNSKTTSAPAQAQRTPRPGEVVRIDSWENALTNLNVLGSDKRLAATPSLSLIDWTTAEILWRSDDMAARVIELVPYEETREGFELCADETEGDDYSDEQDPNAEGGSEYEKTALGEPDPEEGSFNEGPTDPVSAKASAPKADPNAKVSEERGQAQTLAVQDPASTQPVQETPATRSQGKPPGQVITPAEGQKDPGVIMTPEANTPSKMPDANASKPPDVTDPKTADPDKKKSPFKKDEEHADAFPPPKKPEVDPVTGEPAAPAASASPATDPKVDPNALKTGEKLPAKPGEAETNPNASKVSAKPPAFAPKKPAIGTSAKPAAPNAPPPPGVPKVQDKKKDDPLEQLENALCEDLDILAKLYEARTYARGHGGGAWLLGADDGQRDMSQPLVPERVRKFDWINVLHPRELSPASWYGDPTAPKYGDVQTYYLTPDNIDGVSRIAGTQIIHESRIVRFDGVIVSKRHRRESMNGWGDSILVRLYEVLRDFQSTWSATGVLMQDFAQTIFKMKGLADLVASSDPDDQQSFRNRVRAADYSRSVLNSVMLDADGEDFERKTTNVTGLPDLLEKFAVRLAAAARVPVTKLMGQSPAGLNATGDADIRWFYDDVKAGQVKHLTPAIRYVAELKATAMGLKLPSKWSVKWKPLWQLDELQEATRRKTVLEMAQIAVSTQMITPEEAAVSLFGGDVFSADIKLSTPDRTAFAQERQSQDQEAAQMNLEAAKAGGFPPKGPGKFGKGPPGMSGKKPTPFGKPPSGGGSGKPPQFK